MPLTLEQYATWLDTRDLPWPASPDVTAPKAKPHVVGLPNVRAVTWNVYGTLLAIFGGELLFEHPNQFVMDVALEKTIQEFNMWASMTRKPGQPAESLKPVYRMVLAEQAFAGRVKNAETHADKVWEAILKKLLQKDYRWDTSFYGSLNEYSAKVAYFFHASLQGTGCYPGAAEALGTLAERGVVQGLLADAQCFTEVQLQRGLQAQDAGTRLERLADPRLSALSFQAGVRKPDERLFRQALAALQDRGITPDQVLHVGSRVAQDIAPARRLGMRTALFAGDAASLQATPDQLKAPASRPDILLTELGQIAEVVGSS